MKNLLIVMLFIMFQPMAYCNFYHGLKETIYKNAQAQKQLEIEKQQRGEVIVVNNTYATNWLDRFHDTLFITIQGQITRADTLFISEKKYIKETPHSNFELALYGEVENGDKTFDFAVKPRFDIDLAIPNLERSLKLYINTTKLGTLPGATPMEEDGQLHIGIKSVVDIPESWVPKISTSFGIDWRWPPDPYVEVALKKHLNLGSLRLYPSQSFWISTLDKLGEKTTLEANYWLSPKMVSMIWSSIKYTEDDGFFSWEQSESLVYCLDNYGLKMNPDKMHYCGLKFSMFGENSLVTEYRIATEYAFPIYKDWIFLEITPMVKFERDNDWEGVRVLRVGVRALFWGVYNLQK